MFVDTIVMQMWDSLWVGTEGVPFHLKIFSYLKNLIQTFLLVAQFFLYEDSFCSPIKKVWRTN
jgi:hypothetical protein